MDLETRMAELESCLADLGKNSAEYFGSTHGWFETKLIWNKVDGGIGSPCGGFATETGTTISQFIKPMTFEFLRYVIKIPQE